MKKSSNVFVLIWLVLLTFAFVGCKENNLYESKKDMETSKQTIISDYESKENVLSEEKKLDKSVEAILNRKIFLFKDSLPELHNYDILKNDDMPSMSDTIAYAADWNFRQVLNDNNYANIKWEIVPSSNGIGELVYFSGISKNPKFSASAEFCFEFCLDDSGNIFGTSVMLLTSENTVTMSVKEMVEMGVDASNALLGVDFCVSTFAVANSVEGVASASDYYIALGNEKMSNNDYDSAIVYYKKAKNAGDKLSAAYYAKAEQYMKAGNFDKAKLYFEYSGSYRDSSIRILEIYYLLGQDFEKSGNYVSAIENYEMAGGYSDAKEKYKKCNYELGKQYFNNNQYYEACISFETAAKYNDSAERYKECCYLYAEQKLLEGNLNIASEYFSRAGDYKDASIKMTHYYYETGNEMLESKRYLEAAECFANAGNFKNSQTMILECYYLYGAQQMQNNVISESVKYLKKCRGYKDTDEILLGYYYSEAVKAMDLLMNNVNEQSCADTLKKIELCEGYGNSERLTKIAQKLYDVTKYLYYNNYVHFTGMDASYDNNNITLSRKNVYGYSGNLTLNYNVENGELFAEIKLATCDIGFAEIKGICKMICVFCEIDYVDDLEKMLSDDSQWSKGDGIRRFLGFYDGINVCVTEKRPDPHSYIFEHTISVKK